MEDTLLEDQWLLKKDSMVQMSSRLMHIDSSLWGLHWRCGLLRGPKSLGRLAIIIFYTHNLYVLVAEAAQMASL